MRRGDHHMSAREMVWFQVAAEMGIQDEKWGVQNHDMLPHRGGLSDPLATLIASADHARQACEDAARMGEVTWAHIMIEEVAEACDAPDLISMRQELVQVAAVVHQAIGALDRHMAQEGSA